MSRFGAFLCGIVLILLFAWFPGYLVQSVLDAFEFARDGVEKQAQIVQIESKRTNKYGDVTWQYRLQIEQRTFSWSFSEPRLIGGRLSMLELANEPDKRMLGRRGDSAFDLLLLEAGGSWGFALSLAMGCVSAAVVPIVFVLWIKFLLRPRASRWSESF